MRTQVLDHGYVEFVEAWGHGRVNQAVDDDYCPRTDMEPGIIEAARMSTQASFRDWSALDACDRCGAWVPALGGGGYKGDESCAHEWKKFPRGDEGLLSFLYNSKPAHAGPFEFAGMTIEIQCPLFVRSEHHRHRTQCIHPDTLIHFDAPKSRENRRFVYKMRIEDIWKKWQPTIAKRPERQTNAFWPRSRLQTMQLRSLDEECREFYHTRIVDAIRGEPKDMVRVTTASGRSIRLTLDHRVLTSTGWMRLGDALKSGALLTLEGTTRAKSQRWEVPPADSTEEWRSVMGWEGLYYVSSFGRVKRISCDPKKPTEAANGYDVVSLSRGGVSTTHHVHTLVLEAFKGKKPSGLEARHLNDNRADARASNLAWGTPKENARDRIDSDRQQRLAPVFEEISEVANLGLVPTYDLSVEGPFHNFVADGLVVHNSYNEMSARYAPLPDLNYVPTIARLMMASSTSNKQAQSAKGASELTEIDALFFQGELIRQYIEAERLYQDALSRGVAKELARAIIPVGRYTRFRATANLRNWLAFMTLRYDPAAQWEIQQYAIEVGKIIGAVFPRTWRLFSQKRSVESAKDRMWATLTPEEQQRFTEQG